MTVEPTETLLRESLEAHAHDLGPAPAADPWLRVSRAHRRSQVRRRTAAIGAVTAVVAAGSGLAVLHPWPDPARPTQPADNRGATATPPAVDVFAADGAQGWQLLTKKPGRGKLGHDQGLARDVAEALRDRQKVGSVQAQVIWADVVGDRRRALVASDLSGPARKLSWLTGPAAGGSMKVVYQQTSGPAISAMNYRTKDGQYRLLAIVQPRARASTSRLRIDLDGAFRRNGPNVPVSPDGVIDIPVTDPLRLGPQTLWVLGGKSVNLYASTSDPETASEDGQRPEPQLPGSAELTAALRGARGPSSEPRPDLAKAIATKAVTGIVTDFQSTAALTRPQVEWTGTVPAARGGGSLVAVTAGLPDQGRMLTVSRESDASGPTWNYVAPLAEGNGPGTSEWTTAWRVPAYSGGKPAGQVVGWWFGRDYSSVQVMIDGKVQKTITEDGLGWVTVQKDQKVEVVGNRTNDSGIGITLRPDDVDQPDLHPFTN